MVEWDFILGQQKEFCKRLKMEWSPVDLKSMIAFNESMFSKVFPINGLRHHEHGNIDGWYLWSGSEIPQEDAKLFKPLYVEHLIEHRPVVLKYLGLPPGWRFQIDDKGYEDVWFDESILVI
jgi:hypothetical protein